MMSAKMATLGLLEIKIFWNKVYDVLTFINEVTNKILSGESNYIVDVIMWQSLITRAFLWQKLQ